MNRRYACVLTSFIFIAGMVTACTPKEAQSVIEIKTQVDSISEEYNAADFYDSLTHIDIEAAFDQKEEEYYLYFYRDDCPDCVDVEETMSTLKEQVKIYAIDCNIEKNKGNRYDWSNSMHELIPIGTVREDGILEYYEGESEEKYLNSVEVNQYGHLNYYKIDTMPDDDNNGIETIYAKMITPEIDYSTVITWEELIIAGVPTLLHVNTNRQIDEFYFDSPEINSLELDKLVTK